MKKITCVLTFNHVSGHFITFLDLYNFFSREVMSRFCTSSIYSMVIVAALSRANLSQKPVSVWFTSQEQFSMTSQVK